jgi:hypothetical protein
VIPGTLRGVTGPGPHVSRNGRHRPDRVRAAGPPARSVTSLAVRLYQSDAEHHRLDDVAAMRACAGLNFALHRRRVEHYHTAPRRPGRTSTDASYQRRRWGDGHPGAHAHPGPTPTWAATHGPAMWDRTSPSLVGTLVAYPSLHDLPLERPGPGGQRATAVMGTPAQLVVARGWPRWRRASRTLPAPRVAAVASSSCCGP